MWKCNFCGTENVDNALFCELCGHISELGNGKDDNNHDMRDEDRAEEIVRSIEVITDNCEAIENEVDNHSAYIDESSIRSKEFCGKSKSNSRTKAISLFAIAAIVILVAGLWFGRGNNIDENVGDDVPDIPPTDINETNDSAETATFAQVGNTYKGVLSSAEDKDYFCIPANGHASLRYTFVRNSSRTIDGIGWEISYHNGGYISSRMAWLNEKSLTDECDGINVTDGYFIVWIENTRSDSNMGKVMEFVSHTEYSITFDYVD